jgi:hypothetical protein
MLAGSSGRKFSDGTVGQYGSAIGPATISAKSLTTLLWRRRSLWQMFFSWSINVS